MSAYFNPMMTREYSLGIAGYSQFNKSQRAAKSNYWQKFGGGMLKTGQYAAGLWPLKFLSHIKQSTDAKITQRVKRHAGLKEAKQYVSTMRSQLNKIQGDPRYKNNSRFRRRLMNILKDKKVKEHYTKFDEYTKGNNEFDPVRNTFNKFKKFHARIKEDMEIVGKKGRVKRVKKPGVSIRKFQQVLDEAEEQLGKIPVEDLKKVEAKIMKNFARKRNLLFAATAITAYAQIGMMIGAGKILNSDRPIDYKQLVTGQMMEEYYI